MTYARAGHTPLIVRRTTATAAAGVQVLAPDGMVLGLRIDDGELFERLLEEQTLPLGHGDLLLFFTDGISEAMNAEADCFGESRLARLVEEHGDLPLERAARADPARDRGVRRRRAPARRHDDDPAQGRRAGRPLARTRAWTTAAA